MTAQTLDLFPVSPKIRSKPVHRMHVSDAGNNVFGDTAAMPHMGRFECGRCRYETDWTPFRTVTEAKRGLPCPKCNRDCAIAVKEATP